MGPEFPKIFLEADALNSRYFISSLNAGHYMFDLPKYLTHRMKAFGVGQVDDLALCTYSDPDWFFSYRRTTHRQESDYGRLISAIALGD